MTEDVRSELRSLLKQAARPWLRQHQMVALQKRIGLAVEASGFWGRSPAEFYAWLGVDASGEPLTPVAAAQASRSPAAVPSSSRSTPVSYVPTRAPALAEPHAASPSRAEQIAAIHLSSINESRERCGLAALSAAELAHEFAEVDLSPPTRSARSWAARRAAGNAIAAAQGFGQSQDAVDAMYAGIAAKLNTTIPATGEPIAAQRAPASNGGKQNQVDVDAMWASLAAGVNKEAGLKAPAR